MTSTPNDPARPDDERISAWVDGELDEDGIKAMDHLALNDQPTAARALRLRQLDDLVRTAVPLEEAIPDELLERMGLAERPASTQTAEVIDLGSARAARQALAGSRTEARGFRYRRLAASVALLVGLGFTAMLAVEHAPDQQADSAYRTLSSPAEAGPAANAVIMVAPDTARSAIEAAATRAGARVLGEAAETGAIRLAIDPARRDAVLAELRSQPGVTMAEPLDGAQP